MRLRRDRIKNCAERKNDFQYRGKEKTSIYAFSLKKLLFLEKKQEISWLKNFV
jgi:hypothetical protein